MARDDVAARPISPPSTRPIRPARPLEFEGRARAHVYAVCFNEMPMLPYFLRHYRQIAARFWLFDDGSTDGTLEYLHAQPDVEVERLERDTRSVHLSFTVLHNTVWKRSRGRADWVVICDIDEHLYHPDLAGYLDRCRARGVTVIAPTGYQMVADSFPKTHGRLCDELVLGARWANMDKFAIFDPDAVQETNYSPGRHSSELEGRVVLPENPEVKLLHYRYLGFEYVRTRNRELAPRLGPVDIRRTYGHKYRWDDATLRADFDRWAAAAQAVV